ncbi:MAG: SMC-Scp complex subunit ScpB [Lachnospiraceae bacterium]|nr:SMC-Scp complex subunit ScpB [Lachnospiraceae bacterium]
MELQELEATVEAILFTMGEAVAVSQIATAIGHDEETTKKIIYGLQNKLAEEKRGVQIIELDQSFQMCTKMEYYPYLTKLVNQPKRHTLTDVMLETLSIIAYKQPITKQEIEAIRGVKCDHAVNKLIEYNLVEEVGRLEAIGRPILFGTTTEFLRSFGVTSIDELPIINPSQVENFKQEAIEEMQLTLDI